MRKCTAEPGDGPYALRRRRAIVLFGLGVLAVFVFASCHCTDQTDVDPDTWDVGERDSQTDQDADAATRDDAEDIDEDVEPDDTGGRDTGANDGGDVGEDAGQLDCAYPGEECEETADCCAGLYCESVLNECFVI